MPETMELSPFHLKEALYSFSLLYLNFQHHHCCTLRPLSVKHELLGHKHSSTITVNLLTEKIPSDWWAGSVHAVRTHWTKEWSSPRLAGGGAAGGFITLCRMVCVRTYELFTAGIFHMYFWTAVTVDNRNCGEWHRRDGSTTAIHKRKYKWY